MSAAIVALTMLLWGGGGAGAPALAQENGAALLTTFTVAPSPTVTPTPNATATASAALFTVGRAELVSRYPAGVEYVFEGSSAAGDIERVQVIWWTNTGTPERSPLRWDAEQGVWTFFDRLYSPPWYQIHYRFRAVDSQDNIYETPEQVSEYADNTRKWLRRENDDIIVLMFGARDSLVDDLFWSAAASILRLEDAFGFSLDYKPYVVVMPDQASFQEWQEHPDPYLAGLTLQELGYTIQTLQWGETDLVHTTIPHELTHIFQGFVRKARDLPTWLIEGNATYFEPTQQYDYERRVRDAAAWLPTLQRDMTANETGPDGRNRWTYDVGYTFIKYWIDNYGWESHRAFWEAQKTMNFRAALEAATGVTFEELENGWRTWLGAGGPAPTLIPLPTMPPLPTSPPMPTLPSSS